MFMPMATKKENPVLQAWPTQIFHFGRIFLIVCENWVKSVIFGQSGRKFGCKFSKITENTFPKFFSKKKKDRFLEILVFLGGHFSHQKEKKIKNKKNKTFSKNVLTNRPYSEGPSTHKTEFLFFVALRCICQRQHTQLSTFQTYLKMLL